jgi:mono/diheme cytochrome c family protein
VTRFAIVYALVAGLTIAASGAVQGQDAVERGAYLAAAGDCLSCHTAPGGQPFAGGLRMETPFGALITPNITPDDATGLGRWTADEFYRAMHDGVGRNGQDLYPVMPYTFYTKVTREDVDAIWAWLRTVPPVHNQVDVDQLLFPFDIRLTQLFWRELYFTPGTYVADPRQSTEWNRGAYLVEGLGHCGACHSPRDALGGIEQGERLTGAKIDHWFALNLTSDLRTGLGDWSVEQVVDYLRAGAAKGKTTALGPMAEVVHNSLGKLTSEDLRAMAVYLKSVPAQATPTAPPLAGRPPGAGVLYVQNCAGCHQAKGTGVPGTFPPLAGNPVVTAPDPTDALSVILGGVPSRGGYRAMPAFAGIAL